MSSLAVCEMREGTAPGESPATQKLPYFRLRIVAKKSGDGWQVDRRRGGCVEFPVGDGQRMDANGLGDVSLIEPAVKAALSDVIA